MELKPEDLVISTYRAPHQSKSGWATDDPAGIVINHIPSGAMVKCDTERNPTRNKMIAMEMLETKVKDIMEARKGLPIPSNTPPMPAVNTPVLEEESFRTWLEREMPAGTVIGDPSWWADRILIQVKARIMQLLK